MQTEVNFNEKTRSQSIDQCEKFKNIRSQKLPEAWYSQSNSQRKIPKRRQCASREIRFSNKIYN